MSGRESLLIKTFSESDARLTVHVGIKTMCDATVHIQAYRYHGYVAVQLQTSAWPFLG